MNKPGKQQEHQIAYFGSAYILVNTKKLIFRRMIESILSYFWTLDCELQKKLYRTELDFWRRAARTFRIPKVRHKIRGKKSKNKNLVNWKTRR